MYSPQIYFFHPHAKVIKTALRVAGGLMAGRRWIMTSDI